LCNTPPDAAHALLERLRQAMAQLRIPHPAERPETPARQHAAPEPLRITVSIGFALHVPGERIEATLERADRALYAAKAGGRDRTVAETALLDPDTMASCRIGA
ncbi:diguanylate cyclase, partial [Rhizobium leguminosarum]|uniref:diguanylate cyclase domain-containing protein n=2 Tax=Pseudomonadota TaxID=1224 RepID=UPI0013DF7AD4